jgi:hypothetical protein
MSQGSRDWMCRMVPQFVSGFSTMNKWLNFSQLICFNNVKGLKEYCMRWCSHATDMVL